MTYEEFLKFTERDTPPNLKGVLLSLWWDKKGDWDKAHSIAQDIPTSAGSLVHAYLHRKEGVIWNADYWYNRAGRIRPQISLETEWEEIAKELVEISP